MGLVNLRKDRILGNTSKQTNKKSKREKRTYNPGGVVIMGFQLLNLPLQYC